MEGDLKVLQFIDNIRFLLGFQISPSPLCPWVLFAKEGELNNVKGTAVFLLKLSYSRV
jgi:hypothetical protein